MDLRITRKSTEKYSNQLKSGVHWSSNCAKETDTERIDTLEATTDDIILMMADLIGGEA